MRIFGERGRDLALPRTERAPAAGLENQARGQPAFSIDGTLKVFSHSRRLRVNRWNKIAGASAEDKNERGAWIEQPAWFLSAHGLPPGEEL